MFGGYSRHHESVNSLLQSYYGSLQSTEFHEVLHKKLTSVVAVAMKKTKGRIHAFTTKLADSSEVTAVQKTADLITANIYRCV